MTLQIIPVEAVASQSVAFTIGGQRLRLEIAQKAFGIFVNVYANDALVIGGVLARNFTRIVRSAYLGLAGDFFFYDTQGTSDPYYDQLGTRFLLYYTDQLT